MKLDGNQSLFGALKQGKGFMTKKVDKEDQSMGKNALEGIPHRKNQDSYTPSAERLEHMQGQESAAQPMSVAEDTSSTASTTAASTTAASTTTAKTTSSQVQVSSTSSSAQTFSTAEDYNKYLLNKYEGMTTYNITVSEEALKQAMSDPEKAKTLENYIAGTIDTHDNYDGDWIRVHTETNIKEIGDNGKVSMSALHVFASSQEYADEFLNKMEADGFTNSLERLLLGEDNGFSSEETDLIKDIISTFDSIFNGTNPETGFSNFLNSVLMSGNMISDELLKYNEDLMEDATELRGTIDEWLEKDDLSDEMRSILTEAADKLDDLVGGDNPLYEMRVADINVTIRGKNPDFTYPPEDGEDSFAFPNASTDEVPSFEDFKSYFMKSNSNMLNLMLNSEVDEDTALQDYFDNLLELQEAKKEEND